MKNLPEELLSAYLDGELTAQEQAQIERLLAESAEARQLLEELRLLSQSLQRLPVHKLKEDLAAKVLQEAQRREAESPAAAASPPASLPTGSVPTPAAAQLTENIPTEGISAACPACRPIGQPTAEAKPGAGVPPAGERTAPPTWHRPPWIRRLLTSRGLIWSAVAVLVAVAIWWFGPPARGPIPQVAFAPRDLAERHPLASPFANLSDKPADRDHKITEERSAHQSALELANASRPGPTGAAIRARSDEAVPPTSQENALALAQSSPTAHFGMAPAGPKPSSDRAAATDKLPSEALPEAVSKGPGLQSPMAPGADGLAARKAGPESMETGPTLAKHTPHWETAGKDRPGQEQIAKESPLQQIARKQSEGQRNHRLGPEPDAKESAKESMDAGPATLAAKGSPAEKVLRSTVQMGSAPSAGAGAMPPVSAEPPALVARRGIGRSKAAESPPGAKPTPIAEGTTIAQGAPMPGAALAAKQPPTTSLAENHKADFLPESRKPALPQVHALLPDTTLVVVCDVSASALRQRTLEQILSEHQIRVAEGEEVLEEAAVDTLREAPALRKTWRPEAVVSGPGKLAEASDLAKPAETDAERKPEVEKRASSSLPPGQPAEPLAEEKAGASPSAAAPERLASRAEQAKKSPQPHKPTPSSGQAASIAPPPAGRDAEVDQPQAPIRQEPSIARHPAGPDLGERGAAEAGAPRQTPPGLPARDREQQTAESRPMDQMSPGGAGGAGPGPESQLQFLLLEASPEQLEATLRAIQARSEEFLAISISPAPADPAQQIYQQYSRTYRAPTGPPAPAPPKAPRESEMLRPQTPPVGQQKTLGQQQAFGRQEVDQQEPVGRQQPFGQEHVGPQQVGPQQPGGPQQAIGPPAALGQQQPFGQQQAWARRLRLPEHLSRQLLFAQQAPFRQQIEADQPPMALQRRQAAPDQQQAEAQTRSAGGAPLAAQAVQPIMSSPPEAGKAPEPKGPPSPERIRVLFVLRPAEAAP